MFNLTQNGPLRDLQSLEKTLDELMIRNQMLDRNTEELLKELKVSPEQLSILINDESSFTSENWKVLNEEKKKIEEKLSTELKNIRNPLKTKKTLSQQRTKQEWLFVK